MDATKEGNLSAVNTLLKKGANVHHNNDDALQWAAVKGHLDILNCLLEADADVHTLDDSPLQLATFHENFDIITCLLDNGATFNPKWRLISQDTRQFCLEYQASSLGPKSALKLS